MGGKRPERFLHCSLTVIFTHLDIPQLRVSIPSDYQIYTMKLSLLAFVGLFASASAFVPHKPVRALSRTAARPQVRVPIFAHQRRRERTQSSGICVALSTHLAGGQQLCLFLFYLFLDQPLFCVPHIYFKVLILIELPAPTTILSRRRRSR